VTTIAGPIAITAGVEQSRVSDSGSGRPQSTDVIDRLTQIPSAATIDESNATSIERNRLNGAPSAETPIDSIRITSSLGRSEIRGSLTESRAIELYEKIARLL